MNVQATLLALPDTMPARRSLELVLREESPAIANHSIRSFLFARLFADHVEATPGSDYDPELLFLACVLHDLGLGSAAGRDLRFEVDGANMAAKFLTDLTVPAADVDAVWEAIALHTSAHIAEQRNTLCYLTRSGINLDFGPPAGFLFGPSSEFITDDQGAAIHEAYPRYSMATALANAVIEQATAWPATAPPFSPAAVMTTERLQAPDHLSWTERAASAGRWGN